MRIRRMREGDLNTVAELESQIFPDPWSRESFDFELRRNRYSLPLVLEEKGDIIGYAIIWRIYEEFHLANIAIRPDRQGAGRGSKFLRELLNLSGECRFAVLEVREGNTRAIRMYEKFGFRTIFRRPGYYKNGETALVMQKIFETENSDRD